MAGVNPVAAHASLIASLRSDDMCQQAMTAASAYREAQLSRTRSQSTQDLTRHSSPKAAPASRRGASPASESSRIRAQFRKVLLQRYHTIVAAWRELDPRYHGRLAYFDFCRACRNIGYDGEARLLWEALDADSDGFVLIQDVDEALAALLKGFVDSIVKVCGSAEAAWQLYFCSNGMGRCSSVQFAQSCANIGYHGNVDGVFEALNADRCSVGISFQEFKLLDRWFLSACPGRWQYGRLRPKLNQAEI
mmetsp:Transcript_57852/g.161476  ORF Transcript_57852/g.161476 Transcript_57852/m.161476 type:complete len:249 (+) Transcript_57852:82-828(+)